MSAKSNNLEIFKGSKHAQIANTIGQLSKKSLELTVRNSLISTLVDLHVWTV